MEAADSLLVHCLFNTCLVQLFVFRPRVLDVQDDIGYLLKFQ